MPSGGVAMHSLDLFFHCEMVNLAFKKRFEDFLFLNRIIAYYFSIFANQNLYTRYEEEIMYFDKVSLCSNTFFILLPILIMTSTFNQSGGVVKVEIYEVDTKIALKVDTFWLHHLCRHGLIRCRLTRFDFVIYVDMDWYALVLNLFELAAHYFFWRRLAAHLKT